MRVGVLVARALFGKSDLWKLHTRSWLPSDLRQVINDELKASKIAIFDDNLDHVNVTIYTILLEWIADVRVVTQESLECFLVAIDGRLDHLSIIGEDTATFNWILTRGIADLLKIWIRFDRFDCCGGDELPHAQFLLLQPLFFGFDPCLLFSDFLALFA